MSNASIVWRSDDKDVIASLQKMEKRNEALVEQLKKVKKESKEGGDAAKSATADWASSVLNVASGYLSINAALQLGNKLLQDQADLQDKVAESQKSAADQQIKFLRNLGNVSQAERESAIGEISQISKRTGVSETQLYTASSSAMSARGGLSIKEALSAVEQAATLAPEDTGENTAIASGLLDLASLTKSADAKRNAGLLVAMQQQARNVNLQSVAKNLVPGAISLSSYGASVNEAVAATTSMTQAMKDPEGAISSTAMIALAEQAKDITPGGFGEDIAKLKSDPAIRDRFLAKASFEKKAAAHIKNFLTAGSETSNLYEQYKGNLPTAENSGDVADQLVGGIKSQPLQQVASADRAMAAAAERARIGDIDSASYSSIRKRVDELAQSAGVNYAARLMLGVQMRGHALVDNASPAEMGLEGMRFIEQEIYPHQMDEEGRATDKLAPDATDHQKQLYEEFKKVNETLQEIARQQKERQTAVNAHNE